MPLPEIIHVHDDSASYLNGPVPYWVCSREIIRFVIDPTEPEILRLFLRDRPAPLIIKGAERQGLMEFLKKEAAAAHALGGMDSGG